jgi:hypothetical protein
MEKNYPESIIVRHTEYDYKTKTKEMLENEIRMAHLGVGESFYTDNTKEHVIKRTSRKTFETIRVSDGKVVDYCSLSNNNSFQYLGC